MSSDAVRKREGTACRIARADLPCVAYNTSRLWKLAGAVPGGAEVVLCMDYRTVADPSPRKVVTLEVADRMEVLLNRLAVAAGT